jgi:hypothetical protein
VSIARPGRGPWGDSGLLGGEIGEVEGEMPPSVGVFENFEMPPDISPVEGE